MATFINLCEFLLQKAVQHEEKAKAEVTRAAQLWAKGHYGLSEMFRNLSDYDFAQSEQLFARAAGYEMTRKFLATPEAATLEIAIGETPPPPSPVIDYAVC